MVLPAPVSPNQVMASSTGSKIEKGTSFDFEPVKAGTRVDVTLGTEGDMIAAVAATTVLNNLGMKPFIVLFTALAPVGETLERAKAEGTIGTAAAFA